ncbi:MAG TPA: DinB family protein [Chryseolinea sp.]
MKRTSILILFALSTVTISAQTLKSVLLNQVKTTHDKEDWFVPVNVALKGVTAEQAVWKDGSVNHSIGQLANHLLFWNERQLKVFKGQKNEPFNGNNDETFNTFTKEQWTQTVQRLDEVLSEIENIIQNADEASLKSWAETIGNISTHNSYHTGQIIFVRKLQGNWKTQTDK